MSNLNPNDSLENLELGERVVSGASGSLLTKALRALLATAVLGSVAAYGAITVKPELVDYLSFIPGMEPPATQCTAGACGASKPNSCCAQFCRVMLRKLAPRQAVDLHRVLPLDRALCACSAEPAKCCPAMSEQSSAETSSEPAVIEPTVNEPALTEATVTEATSSE